MSQRIKHKLTWVSFQGILWYYFFASGGKHFFKLIDLLLRMTRLINNTKSHHAIRKPIVGEH